MTPRRFHMGFTARGVRHGGLVRPTKAAGEMDRRLREPYMSSCPAFSSTAQCVLRGKRRLIGDGQPSSAVNLSGRWGCGWGAELVADFVLGMV